MATTKATAASATAEPGIAATVDEYVNTVADAGASVAPQRFFTIPGRDPFD